MEGVVEREDHGPGIYFCFGYRLNTYVYVYVYVYVKENLLIEIMRMIIKEGRLFVKINKNFQIEKYFMLIVFALYCKEVKH